MTRPTTRALAVAAALALAGLAGCVDPAATAPAAPPDDPSAPPPRLEVVGPRVFDLGRMRPGETAGHTWRLRNDGGRPLVLRIAGTSGAPTWARFLARDWESITLGPNQYSEIRADLKAGPAAVGRLEAAVTLAANDAARTHTLALRGRAVQVIHLDPGHGLHKLGTFPGDRYRFFFYSEASPDLKVGRPAFDPAMLGVELGEPAARDREFYKIPAGLTAHVVIIRPTAGAVGKQRFRQTVVVPSKSQGVPDIEVVVSAEQVYPSEADMPEPLRRLRRTGLPPR